MRRSRVISWLVTRQGSAVNVELECFRNLRSLRDDAGNPRFENVGSNRDLAVEEAFLLQHYRTMPRTTLRYAIERLQAPRRLQYLRGEI